MIPDNVCILCGKRGYCIDFKEGSYDIYRCPYCKRFWTIMVDKNEDS